MKFLLSPNDDIMPLIFFQSPSLRGCREARPESGESRGDRWKKHWLHGMVQVASQMGDA